MFTKSAVSVIDKLRETAERNDDSKILKFDIITIITAITSLLPLLQGLFPNCKKKPPDPTPVPAPLSSIGVSQDSWNQACQAKWVATDAWNGTKYRANVLKASVDKLVAEQNIKRKAARPLAIASLDTSRTESAEDLAATIHGVKVANI